jgi:serine/threonine protein phosphatase PrpC
LFCCFDGHGGKEVSLFAETNFEKEFKKLEEFKTGDYKEALRKAFEKTDILVGKEEYCNDTGTTACVVFITD